MALGVKKRTTAERNTAGISARDAMCYLHDNDRCRTVDIRPRQPVPALSTTPAFPVSRRGFLRSPPRPRSGLARPSPVTAWPPVLPRGRPRAAGGGHRPFSPPSRGNFLARHPLSGFFWARPAPPRPAPAVPAARPAAGAALDPGAGRHREVVAGAHPRPLPRSFQAAPFAHHPVQDGALTAVIDTFRPRVPFARGRRGSAVGGADGRPWRAPVVGEGKAGHRRRGAVVVRGGSGA